MVRKHTQKDIVRRKAILEMTHGAKVRAKLAEMSARGVTAHVRQSKLKRLAKRTTRHITVHGPKYITPKAPAIIAKEVNGISGKLKSIPVLVIGVIIGAYMLLKRK